MRDRRVLPVILLCAASMTCSAAVADVFKYVDGAGNVVFSDQPLSGQGLDLEWKRSDRKLVAENRLQSEQIRERQRRSGSQLSDSQLAGASLQARFALRSERLLGRSTIFGSASSLGPVNASATLRERRAHYGVLIERTARQYGLWPELLHAVIRTESAYRADALSSAGACGLMQLMPGTAERFKVKNIWDPAENVRGGATYLRLLLDLFQNDLRLALAAYNAGENAVKRYGNDIPPYPETQEYVRKVLRFLHAERDAFSS